MSKCLTATYYNETTLESNEMNEEATCQLNLIINVFIFCFYDSRPLYSKHAKPFKSNVINI